jgi:streptogramin lyase
VALPIRSGFATALTLMLTSFTASAVGAPTLAEFPLPTQDRLPSGIVLAPDGNLWFSEAAASDFGSTTVAGSMSEFTGLSAPAQGIAVGADGNLWMTEPSVAEIARVTPAKSLTEFPVTGASSPAEIVSGPDGNLWFTESGGAGAIGRITTGGTVREFTSGLTANRQPSGIAAGSDGNLWFTESGAPGAIGRITTGGTVREFTSGLTANRQPSGIAAGSDGNLWFTESGAPGAIGRITPSGTITEFTSGLTANSAPSAIAVADNGAMYFTELNNPGRIATITTSGEIAETATATENSQPAGIAAGPDGNVWFTEDGNHGQIGMITVAPSVGSATASGIAEQTASLTGAVGPNSQSTSYHFDYGPSTAYGAQSAPGSAGSGAGASPVGSVLTGLAPGTLYHFRAVATSGSGTTYGPDATFTTTTPPSLVTGAAEAVTLTGATLPGVVNPRGQATTYHFDWGATSAYGSQVPLLDASVGSDSAGHSLEQVLEGLTPDVAHHFRIIASNCGGCAEGTTYGSDQLFTTAPTPTASTQLASEVGQTTATLGATADPAGAATSYHFDWGETTAYGQRTPAVEASVGSDSVDHALAQGLTGLRPGVVYHYRVVATNCGGCTAGTVYAGDMTFATEQLSIAPTVPEAIPDVIAPPPPVVLPPTLGHTAVAAVRSGRVLVKVPGSSVLQELSATGNIPIGSTVDATHGTVVVNVALNGAGASQSVTLWDGSFVIGQTAAHRGLTTFTLNGRLACPARARAHRRAAFAGASAATSSRRLWSKDNHGHFSTRGQNSVATVRGTSWETVDSCRGTLTVVAQGAVSVRDLHRRDTVLVRAGHRYLARA